jgi:dipeptidyl aminopeptidase/acylaminoacyl peptidase
MKAEFGLPQWTFETSTYAPLPDGRLLCTFAESGRWHLALLDPRSGRLETLEMPYTEFSQIRADEHWAVFGGASPDLAQELVALDLHTRSVRTLRRLYTESIDSRYVSIPRAIHYPTTGGATAHALFYPPTHPDYEGPPGERPPLIVKTHGGPTSAASTALSLRTQFYTSRGIAVVDVDYRGSTGYGRDYRAALDHNWGIADVEDCVSAARYLVDLGEVDADRLAITGGSAGGYTTLAALASGDVFSAGASHYGVSDLEALARDTHKFESRYLERLVGPYPAERARYVERSPVHNVDGIRCPVIFFQGLDDRVVPPDQTEKMVQALRARGIPVAYVPFPGEQHGFRSADNIARALDAELYFFSKVFGFDLAEPVEPVVI